MHSSSASDCRDGEQTWWSEAVNRCRFAIEMGQVLVEQRVTTIKLLVISQAGRLAV
jgi:hypothetical protein